MTRTGFVFANLFRNKTRTALTMLSLVTAFLLFGLLQAVNVMFNAGADFSGATRLIVQARVSFTQALPISQLPRIEAEPGVKRVTYQQWFGGVIGENTQLFVLAVDPVSTKDVYSEFVMPDEQWKAFAENRTSMIAGRQVAEQYGWKIGERIPIKSNIFPNQDGSKNWAFDLVGIFDGVDDEAQRRTNVSYINWNYFNEANQLAKDKAGIYVLSLEDPDQAEDVAKRIDKKFENSPDETKTQTEKDWVLGFAKQIGDIGLIVRSILFAVFFTLLLVVSNTMAQSVRERIPELAVLKTLGFSDGSVLMFVIVETFLMCALGGLIGLGIATGLGIMVQRYVGANFPLSVDASVWIAGGIAVLVLTVLVGLLPALRAFRLKIVDALAGR
ncbi:MAG: ABC transporter permease [Planctomycetota bacterium]